jgi:hypothetical protein
MFLEWNQPELLDRRFTAIPIASMISGYQVSVPSGAVKSSPSP